MCKYFLGIDTSNYKTSIAITSFNGDIVFEKSEFLEVGHGDRGLRQQEAFFKQSNALPLFINEAFSKVNPRDIAAIGVSKSPRRQEGSYMPCFRAGTNFAEILSVALDIPVYYFSHQEGHIEAAISSVEEDTCINGRKESCDDSSDDAIFFHLSGGTTEILNVKRSSIGYDVSIIGGTKDISIGMLLDRIGVKLGFSFPAGKYLDEIALNNFSDLKLPKVKIDDGFFNLSGLETKLIREVEDIEAANQYIPSLFYTISKLLYDSAAYLKDKYNIDKIYFCGGVASSASVRKYINELENKSKNNTKIIFGEPALCGDNAVGISRLAARRYKQEVF